MTDSGYLHRAAREIFNHSLKSVDAYAAVRRTVQLEDASLTLVNTTLNLAANPHGIYCVAIGKAARPMAAALGEILGEHLTAGVITAPTDNISFNPRWRVFEGGHPLPNGASLDAAQAAFRLLRRAERERAPVIFLISGGGSAMMEWPRDQETTLEDLRAVHRALVSCGASIEEINVVRRAISSVKGGGLARSAPHCEQVTLIVSDTNAGEEATVASGPTFDETAGDTEASRIVARYKLNTSLPHSILRVIQQPFRETAVPFEHPSRAHYVLLDNERALSSAAEAASERGFTVEVAREVIEQPVEEGCSMLLAKLFELSRRTGANGRGVCLISGGEFACPVRGQGIGGRNAESVLRWAMELDALFQSAPGISHVVALSAGTDGADGNSPAAGAICDETTINCARQLKLDAHRFLDESNAYTFFQALNNTLKTGPTGTNVRDVRVLLAS